MTLQDQGPDYGRAYRLWRTAAGADWNDYVRHPFVEGLKDGSLPRAAFHHYTVQDYVYLIHYSRAWALGVVKSETREELRACAATVDGLLNTELSLHLRTCAEMGLSEDQVFAARESTANLAYTRYVMDAGQQGDFADLMAALAPCLFGYGEIGFRLGREAGETSYRDWIETYAGEEYQNACIEGGAMIDAALERRLGTDFTASPRWERLVERFATASRLESGFWQMGLDLS